MTASTTDSAKWTALNSNIGSGVVGNPAAIEAALDNVRSVVDQHATEIDGKFSKTGGTLSGPVVVNTSTRIIDIRSDQPTAPIVPITFRRDATEYWWFLLGADNGLDISRQSGSGRFSVNGLLIHQGAGSPEGVVTAPVGSLYQRTDGAATTTLYVKTSGTGNTGWTAK